MIVELLALQPNRNIDHVGLVAQAARVCHKSAGDNDEELVEKLAEWGHTSVFEQSV